MNTNIRIITKSGKEIDYISPENLNLKLNRVVDDLINPDSRFGEYSYTFSLPMTDNNVSIFEYAGVPNITNNFKANPIECIITDDDKIIINGILELRAITTTYDVVMYSVFTQLIDSIKDKSLQDIKSLPHIHDFKYEDTIREHINADYKNSDEANWQFPFVFYNTVYTPTNVFSGTTDQNGVAFRRDNTKQNYYNILNNTDNVDPNEMYFHQFPLAWYLKPVIEGILADAGWTMGGSFFEDENIKKIIMPYVGDSDIYDTATYCTPTGTTTTTTTTLAPSTTTTTTATPVPTTTTTTTLAPTGTTTTSTTTTTLAPTGTTTTTTTIAPSLSSLLAGTDGYQYTNTSTNAISSNGFDWVAIDTPLSLQGYKGCWDGNNWWIGGYGGDDISYSSNGSTWTGLGDLNALFAFIIKIIFNGSQYIAISSMSTNNEGDPDVVRLAYSSNGLSWSFLGHDVISNYNSYSYLRDIIWDGTYWYILGGDGSHVSNNISRSSDGINWSKLAKISTGTAEALTLSYGNGIYLSGYRAATIGDATIFRSTNGSTWSAVSSSSTNFRNSCEVIGFNGSYFTALGRDLSGNANACTSTDGSTWSQPTVIGTSNYYQEFYDIIYDTALGKWFCGYRSNPVNKCIMYSTNGLNWTETSANYGMCLGLASKNEYGIVKAAPIGTTTTTIAPTGATTTTTTTIATERTTLNYYGFSSVSEYGAYNAGVNGGWSIQGTIYLDEIYLGAAYTTPNGSTLANQGWYQLDNPSAYNGFNVNSYGFYSTYNNSVTTTTTIFQRQPVVTYGHGWSTKEEAYADAASRSWTPFQTIYLDSRDGKAYTLNVGGDSYLAANGFFQTSDQLAYAGYEIINHMYSQPYSFIIPTTTTTTTTLAPTTTTTTTEGPSAQFTVVNNNANSTITGITVDGVSVLGGTFPIAVNGGSTVCRTTQLGSRSIMVSFSPVLCTGSLYLIDQCIDAMCAGGQGTSKTLVAGNNYGITLRSYACNVTTTTTTTLSPFKLIVDTYAVNNCGTVQLTNFNIITTEVLTVNKFYWDDTLSYIFKVKSIGGNGANAVSRYPLTFDSCALASDWYTYDYGG